MKARVYVTLKTTVLDPQGATIRSALAGMGHADIADVRQGKYFELQLAGEDQQQAKTQVEKIAREVLTNPVIEEFHYKLEG